MLPHIHTLQGTSRFNPGPGGYQVWDGGFMCGCRRPAAASHFSTGFKGVPEVLVFDHGDFEAFP